MAAKGGNGGIALEGSANGGNGADTGVKNTGNGGNGGIAKQTEWYSYK